MSTSQPSLASAPSRRWLYIGAGFFLVLIGVGMLYRQLSGNTIREQRLEAKREKAMKELASKPQANAEAFSAKLAAKRQEVEATLAREQEEAKRNAPAEPQPLTIKPPVPTTALPPMPPTLSKLPSYPGSITADEPQLASFELARQKQQADQARRLLSWEGSNDQAGGTQSPQSQATSLSALASALGLQNFEAQRSTTATPALNPTALAEAYQKLQSSSSSASDGDENFKRQVAARTKEKQPLTARPGVGRYALHEGSMIQVAMRSGVSSDVGGTCRAQVVRDVYDSVSHQDRLIPAGSVLLCTYNAAVVQGQERLLLVFTRLFFPSGASVDLGSMDGADGTGVIGAPAEVNTRFWRIFSSSFLIAAVTRLAEKSSSSSGITINTSAPGNPAAQVLADVAKKSLDRNLNIKPELRLAPGEQLTVVVNRDMVLDPAVTGVAQ